MNNSSRLFFKPFKTIKMRFSELTSLFEKQTMSISQAKATAKKVLELNGIEFTDKLSKEFDKAIDSISNMSCNVYGKTGFDIKPLKHVETPLFRGEVALKREYNPDSELTKVITTLKSVETEHGRLASVEHKLSHQRIINHKDSMKVVELDEKYFAEHTKAEKSLAKLIKDLGTVTFK